MDDRPVDERAAEPRPVDGDGELSEEDLADVIGGLAAFSALGHDGLGEDE